MKSRVNIDEREISLRELWWYTLSKWKALIIGFVIGAMLLGGFRYYSDYKDYKQTDAKLGKTSEEILEKFTDKEKQQIQLAADFYKKYAEEYDSIDFNYVMTLDSDSVDRVLLQYMVDINYIIDYNGTTIENYTNDVIKMYASAVRTQEFRTAVMNLGIDNLEEKDIDYLVSASSTGNVLEFNIFGHGADCSQIAEVVKNTIENSFGAITDGIGEHEIALLNENGTQVYATSIKNAQTNKRNDLKTVLDTCNSIVNKMSEKQKSAYNTLKYQIDFERMDEKISKPSFNVKMAIIGGCVGLFLVVGIVGLMFICSKKLRSINDIERVYNVCLLGKLWEKASDKSNTIFNKKRHQIINNKNIDEQIVYVVNTVVSICKKEALESLYIAYDASINDKIAEIMNKQLKEAGIQIETGGHVTDSTDALKTVAESKNIIFVEKLDYSEKAVITEEIQTCDNMNINIVGMVITI